MNVLCSGTLGGSNWSWMTHPTQHTFSAPQGGGGGQEVVGVIEGKESIKIIFTGY